MNFRHRCALVAVGVVLALPTAGQAEPESPEALLTAGPFRLTKDGSYALSCVLDGVDAFFFAQSNANGPEGGSGTWAGGAWPHAGLRFRYENTHVEVLPSLTEWPFETFVEEGPVFEGNLFRLVVGTWGGSPSCRLTLNGEEVVLAPSSGSMGLFLDESSFSTGASASAAGLSGAIDTRFEHDAHGFMWVFLTTSRGSTRVRGPDGERHGGAGTFESWVALARPAEGRWTYEIEYGLNPQLFIVYTSE